MKRIMLLIITLLLSACYAKIVEEETGYDDLLIDSRHYAESFEVGFKTYDIPDGLNNRKYTRSIVTIRHNNEEFSQEFKDVGFQPSNLYHMNTNDQQVKFIFKEQPNDTYTSDDRLNYDIISIDLEGQQMSYETTFYDYEREAGFRSMKHYMYEGHHLEFHYLPENDDHKVMIKLSNGARYEDKDIFALLKPSIESAYTYKDMSSMMITNKTHHDYATDNFLQGFVTFNDKVIYDIEFKWSEQSIEMIDISLR